VNVAVSLKKTFQAGSPDLVKIKPKNASEGILVPIDELKQVIAEAEERYARSKVEADQHEQSFWGSQAATDQMQFTAKKKYEDPADVTVYVVGPTGLGKSAIVDILVSFFQDFNIPFINSDPEKDTPFRKDPTSIAKRFQAMFKKGVKVELKTIQTPRIEARFNG
jgi:predicted Ser/Thr protein kinase